MLAGRAGSIWEALNSSFWFLPTVMLAGGVVLFAITFLLDQKISTNLSKIPLVFSGEAHSAWSVLSTVAGSLITVAATVFSLTIVALQLASANYSPRVLRNFTGDRGVQVVLGAYIATFTYSLLVLRVVRTPNGGAGKAIVPYISVTVAVILALVCVVLLIYFIHHIANLIQSTTIIQTSHHHTIRSIGELDDLEKSSAEEDLENYPAFESLLSEPPLVWQARDSGYVQYVNIDGIVEAVASGERTVVELPHGPGSFVAAGLPIVRVWPSQRADFDPPDEEIHEAFFFGKERSFRQDFAFGLRQLVDIALKGISPAVNDPTTSMQAMDRIEAILVALGSKALPRHLREEEYDGTRVLVRVGFYDFGDIVGLAFDQIRRSSFSSGQVAVLERLIEVAERALWANSLSSRQKVLWEQAYTVARLAPSLVSDPHDAANLMHRAVEVGAELLRMENGAVVDSDLEDLVRLSSDFPGGERIREAVEAARLSRRSS